MRTGLILLALLVSAPAAYGVEHAAAPRYRQYSQYASDYAAGLRRVPWPINDPRATNSVPVYMYGYFGARSRHEPHRQQWFNDYMRDMRRGYVW